MKNRLTEDLKVAMLSQKNAANAEELNTIKEKVATIRFINAAIKNKEIEKRVELTDDEILSIIKKQKDESKEEKENQEKAKNLDRAAKLSFQISILDVYLPEELTDDAIEALVNELIEQNGFQGVKDKGNLMKLLMPLVKGKSDGKKVNQIVARNLV
jgi:uncharacterized protein YqeY